MQKKLKEVEKELQSLKKRLKHVKGTETEVYSRIVGYYRSLKNWNKGKRDEFSQRVTFSRELCMPKEKTVHSYKYFFREKCPSCGPVKNIVSTLPVNGKAINVDSNSGLSEAQKYSVLSTPTVLFLDKNGTTVFRSSQPSEINNYCESICKVV